MTWAHASGPPGAWDLDPVVLATALVGIVLYTRGTLRLRARRSVHTPSRPRAASFYVGVVGALAAIVSPLHGWSETLFSAHMTQHLILMVVAGPLIVVGRPVRPLLAALPISVARRVTRARSTTRRHAPLLVHPIAVWAWAVIALWAWHLPSLYEAALNNEFVHALEHATFFTTAVLVWAAVIGERPIGEGGAVLLLFATALQSGALGALLTFAGSVLYEPHLTAAREVGVDPLTDQQLAGVIMWIPSGIVYLAVMAVMLARMLRAVPQAGLEERGTI